MALERRTGALHDHLQVVLLPQIPWKAFGRAVTSPGAWIRFRPGGNEEKFADHFQNFTQRLNGGVEGNPCNW